MVLCTSGLTLCHAAASAIASRSVALFEVRDRNMIDALLVFGQQEHIGIGIDYIDRAAFQPRVTIQLRSTTISAVLDAITHRFGYRWSAQGAVIRVTHSGAILGKRNLLSTRIPRFRVSDKPIGLADCDLKIALFSATHPASKGIVGDCPHSAESKAVSIDVNDATVSQILDAIVASGSAAWVVQQPPWTMDKDLGYGLWQVLPYNRADGRYSAGLQVWGLGLHDR